MGGGSIFAIGDVHGCYEELEALLLELPLKPDSTIVFLGDVVDRGPAARAVIDCILDLKKRYRVVTIRGNHESMFEEYLEGSDPRLVARFVYNGGSATLASYADDLGIVRIPDSHVQYLADLSLWHSTDNLFFVHAAVPDVPLDELSEEIHREYVMWARRSFFNSNFPWGKRIVHGHTAVASVEIGANRINVDTGCVFGGHLSAIELPSHKVYSVRRKELFRPVYLHDSRSRRQAIRFLGSVPLKIDCENRTIAFETVDFSEIGMYLRPVEESDRAHSIFRIGDEVHGVIGRGDHFQIPFSGRVVRLAREADGWHYGLSIAQTEDEVESPPR